MFVARLSPLPFGSLTGRARSFGILSSYPPTACGLATFSAALSSALVASGADVRVVRVVDAITAPAATDRVAAGLLNGSSTALAACADLLNQCDVAVVQHEYGLYGGTDGDEVLQILADLTVPSIVVAHTVLSDPSPHQWSVLNEVAALADHVVVMSVAARDRLCGRFDVDPTKVITIAHGAAIPPRSVAPKSDRPTLLTWGLIGPGKGIERVIDAMSMLRDLPNPPQYLVAGRTHPKVLAAHGESYRHARQEQAARRCGVAKSVTFDAEYRDMASLIAMIQSAAVVVLPYDSTEQVTSGVLVDALAAGKPVVATAFPHAVELLSSGAGLVVPHDDPDAMALALRQVLTDSDLRADMAAEARRLAPGLSWPVVARQYQGLANRLLDERPALV